MDSNNDGEIDDDDDPATDEQFEVDGPGKILAVGIDQRKPATLKLYFPAGVDPNEFEYTLVYDESVIEIYDKGPSAPGQPPSGNLIPKNTDITTIGAITVADLVAELTIYIDGVNLGADDIEFRAAKGPLVIKDKVHVTVALDLDTDSDNDGSIDTTDVEEDWKEDWYNETGDDVGGIPNEPGKRVFVNLDDDNKNGKWDFGDTRAEYGVTGPFDNDFAEIQLQFGGVNAAELGGYELWLGHSARVRLYVGTDKRRLVPDPNDAGDNGVRDYDIPIRELTSEGGYWYKWPLGINADGDPVEWPDVVYAEGRYVGRDTVQWRFVKTTTEDPEVTVLAEEWVNVQVERLIWPTENQEHADWNSRNTDKWDGIELKPAWYISKALVDYIQFPSDKGYIETIHPDAPAATGVTTNEAPSVRSYTGNFTVSFGYEFEARDPAQIGTYVPTINADKFSFVSNSGVKFGTATRPYDEVAGKDFEIAILDVDSMVQQVGGIPSNIPFDTDTNSETEGYTDHPNYADEHLSTLMHGVRYGGNLANMVEHYVDDGAGNPDYDAILASQYNAYSGVTSGVMEINATKDANGLYTVTVRVNGVLTYEAAGLTIDGVDKIKFQSHWGSGVRFTNLYMD